MTFWNLRCRRRLEKMNEDVLKTKRGQEKSADKHQDHVSMLIEPLKLIKKRTRQNVKAGTQLKPKSKTSSLNSFKSSYLGSIHKIWSRLPQSLWKEGLSTNWSRIKSRAKKFFTGKWSPADETARPQRKKTKKNENSSTNLNNELNAHTDWDAIRKDLKDQGISINNLRIVNKKTPEKEFWKANMKRASKIDQIIINNNKGADRECPGWCGVVCVMLLIQALSVHCTFFRNNDLRNFSHWILASRWLTKNV